MSENELLCVAIPGGRHHDGQAVLRAVLVPRLNDPAKRTLTDYAMQTWPAAIRASRFVVSTTLDPDGVESEPLPAVRKETLQDTLWEKLFPASTPVRLPGTGADVEVPRVRPTSRQLNTITRGYKHLAVALNAPSANLALASQHLDELAGELTQIDSPDSADPASGRREPLDHDEFHYRLTLLREHPEILKAIGFVIELSLTLPSMPRGFIKVRCEGGLPPDLRDAIVSPWTQFLRDDEFFLPAPVPGGDYKRGMVDLTRAQIADPDDVVGSGTPAPPWLVATFDVPGGANSLRSADPGHRERPSVPALRSAGIILVRASRQDIFRSRIDRTRRDVRRSTLAADDLVVGYRVDVRAESGQWTSLCKRRATYEVAGEVVGRGPLLEEGHVKDLASASIDGGRLQTSEIVVRWNGWSLAVPQPVFTLGGERPLPDSTNAVRAVFDKVTLEVPADTMGGALPSLRFGRSYFLRCRLADAAGGGRACEDDLDSDECATSKIIYRRVDPVPAPVIAVDARLGGNRAAADRFGPGGQMDCLVIRSDPAARDPAQWQEESQRYPANDARQLFPPAISKEMADYHGMFDGLSAAEGLAVVRRAIARMAIDERGEYSWLADPAADGVHISAVTAPGDAELRPLRESAWGDGKGGKTIRLKAGTSSSGADWSDDDRTATITLRPAEEVSLAVASHVPSTRFNLFEISTWLTGVSTVDANHPMLAPPRTLRLVHAVRMPLSKPGGRLSADRPLGATFARLFTDETRTRRNNRELSIELAGVNVDAASTAQIDVAAVLHDVTDDVPFSREAAVASLPCPRGNEKLPAPTHEFGDTRHRMVDYSLTAISRFTEFFDIPKDASGNPLLDHFRRVGDRIVVSIPSSARPSPPNVLSVAPAFRWEGPQTVLDGSSIVRRRTAAIRLELARPWNVSGAGECLAVVLPAQPSAHTVPAALEKRVSWIHRDPLWTTPAPSALLRPDDFAGQRLPAETVPLPASDSGGGEATVENVVVVPYQVNFVGSGDRKTCYADIEVPNRGDLSYSCMARLVVGRYQPESIPGVELSLCVTTDFVPLMPSRTLTVTRQRDGLRVLLAGLGPEGPAPNRVVARIERFTGSGDSISAVSEVEVADGLGVSGWRRIAGSTSVEGTLNREFQVPVPSDSDPLRLVVYEVEHHRAPMPMDEENALGRDLRQRTVFLDVVSVPA